MYHKAKRTIHIRDIDELLKKGPNIKAQEEIVLKRDRV
jgi:hypothetical protein